jgi:hypothetical protein
VTRKKHHRPVTKRYKILHVACDNYGRNGFTKVFGRSCHPEDMIPDTV